MRGSQTNCHVLGSPGTPLIVLETRRNVLTRGVLLSYGSKSTHADMYVAMMLGDGNVARCPHFSLRDSKRRFQWVLYMY